MKKEQTIQAPNYKDSGIGFTTTPTCVMENPRQWGLYGNSFRLWAYLISRIKKEQFFNGRTIYSQLQGTMGQSAVSTGLKELCDAGFCTNRSHRDATGQFAGYSYTFYAIPKKKELVAKVDPKICEKLEAIGWFDLPCDGNPYNGDAPCHGNPSDGEAPTKGKDENKVIDKNKGISPNPLSEKEGDAGAFYREDRDYSELPEVEVCTNEPTEDDFRPGRNYRNLSRTPVGSRFLEMLRPQQVPGDKALRTFSRMVEKGEITQAYLTFLWEKVILPNHQSADNEGELLKSLPEILEIMKLDAYSATQESFKLWAYSKTQRLLDLWKEAHRPFHQERFNQELAKLASFNVEDGVHFFPETLDPDHYCTPFRLLIYLKRCSIDEAHLYQLENLISVLHNDEVWSQLLDRAKIGPSNFMALEHLISDSTISTQIPQIRKHDVQNLRENYSEQHEEKKAELVEKFAALGANPPAVQPSE